MMNWPFLIFLITGVFWSFELGRFIVKLIRGRGSWRDMAGATLSAAMSFICVVGAVVHGGAA